MLHLIRDGVTGGKTVPEAVADHPLVLTTLTAPALGRMHTSGRSHRLDDDQALTAAGGRLSRQVRDQDRH